MFNELIRPLPPQDSAGAPKKNDAALNFSDSKVVPYSRLGFGDYPCQTPQKKKMVGIPSKPYNILNWGNAYSSQYRMYLTIFKYLIAYVIFHSIFLQMARYRYETRSSDLWEEVAEKTCIELSQQQQPDGRVFEQKVRQETGV